MLFVGGTLYYDIGLHVGSLDRLSRMYRYLYLLGSSCIFGPIFGFLIHYGSMALTISTFPTDSSISILAGFTTMLFGYIRQYIIGAKQNVVIRPAPPQIYLDTIYHIKKTFFSTFDMALKSCIASFMLSLFLNWYTSHIKTVPVYIHSFRQSLYVRFVLLLLIDTMHYMMKMILFFPIKFSKLSSDDALFANLIATGLPRRRKLFSWQDSNSSQRIDKYHSMWQEARDASKATADEMLEATETNVYGPPKLPFLGARRSRTSAWGQCLALQDLLTIARTSTDRRLKLIQPGGQWPTIAWALCGILDATTLQLQLVVAQAVEDIIVSDTEKFNESVPKPQGAQLIGDDWSGVIPWSARDIVSKKKRNAKRVLFQDIFFKVFGEFGSTDFLSLDPLPSATAQLGIHAIESVSIILQKALREDNTGIPQYHLAAVINSLLALDLILKEYASAIIRVRAVDKKLRSQKRFSRSVGLMSKELQALHKVTNEALTRIIKSYADLIVTYTFPPVYAKNLSERLKNI